MKRSLRTSYSIAILLVLLTVGCATPPENSNATANNNATANANAPSLTAQPATPPATSAPTAAPTAVSPAPVAQPAPATAKPAETAAKPAEADKTPRVEGPKLVLLSQEKELDFGKQPEDKTMVRPIRIKKGGTEALNIELVTPS